MGASDVSTSTSTLVTVVTISLSTPTESTTQASEGSSNSNDLLVGVASAGGFALLLSVVGLLFCLKYTRAKHRRRIGDMERRLNGLATPNRPSPARQLKRYSTATGTSLGSNWGAWRSKDVKSFQVLRTANQAASGKNRKSFGQGWWSFAGAQADHPNVTPLDDITSSRSVSPPQTNNASENDMQPLMAPRLPAIVECPSPTPVSVPAPARPDPLGKKTAHHSTTDNQVHTGDLSSDKEINVHSKLSEIPSRKDDGSLLGKEVIVSKANIQRSPESRSPLPSIPSKTHQRKPALAGSISVFPSGAPTGADAMHSTSSRHRPFSVINEDPLAAPRRPVPPPPPTRKPIANRPARGNSHIRNQSAFSDDSRSSVENLVVVSAPAQPKHTRSSSAQSNIAWPWDIHSPKIDYGTASDPVPRFKQYRSPRTVAEESQERLQNLTTSEVDVSTAAKIESTDPRAAEIADSYRNLVADSCRIMVGKEQRQEPVALNDQNRVSEGRHSSNKLISKSKIGSPFGIISVSTDNHANFPPASSVSPCASSTRSSQGNPFHYGESSTRSNSFQTTSTSYLIRHIPRSRTGIDPVLNTVASAASSSTTDIRRIVSQTKDKQARAANGSSPDLNIVTPPPPPPSHYFLSALETSKMRSLPKCQQVRKVGPILEQDEPMGSANSILRHVGWNDSSNRCAQIDPSPSVEPMSSSSARARSSSSDSCKSRDNHVEAYNMLTGTPFSRESSFRKKSSPIGASETFVAVTAEDRFPTCTVPFRRNNSSPHQRTKTSLVGSAEALPSYADRSLEEDSSVASAREHDNCTGRRIRELKKTRPSGFPRPLSPGLISEDEVVDKRTLKAPGPFPTISSNIAHPSSHDVRECVSLKSLTPSTQSETTPSEVDARETARILLQSFPSLPPLPSSSISLNTNCLATTDLSSTAPCMTDGNSECINAIPSARQGYGPGPSLSLLEKWEKQGRSYLTNQAAIAAKEDGNIQTFARGRSPRNVSPAFGGGKRTNNGETNGHPLIESTKKIIKHTRWESRSEIAEIIPQNPPLQIPLQKPLGRFVRPLSPFLTKSKVAGHNREESTASMTTHADSNATVVAESSRSSVMSRPPLKPLPKPSESAKRAQAARIKGSKENLMIKAPEKNAVRSSTKKIRGPSPVRNRGPRVEELGKILGGKGVGW
ncbi:hypothetical protein FKW77_009942 [Venturia effusa]|uniref:Uncharacterized protein n=1 Tax=Venturia effusa TaxID=50376 RepID=A0A517L0B4_9PEZI|nr:hypothetical protein FKW77_009942 [Venturia effusa]